MMHTFTPKVARSSPKAASKVLKPAKGTEDRVIRALDSSKAARNKKVMQARFVESSKGDVLYLVTDSTCTCPDFQYRRRARGEACKHMKQAQAMAEGVHTVQRAIEF